MVVNCIVGSVEGSREGLGDGPGVGVVEGGVSVGVVDGAAVHGSASAQHRTFAAMLGAGVQNVSDVLSAWFLSPYWMK